jgi:hypothetical protein
MGSARVDGGRAGATLPVFLGHTPGGGITSHPDAGRLEEHSARLSKKH